MKTSTCLNLVLVPALATLMLSACGGGGGGSGSSGGTPGATGGTPSTDNTVHVAGFPVGVALASPTALDDASSVIAGAIGVGVTPSSASKVMAQAVVSSEADAVASGRLALSQTHLQTLDALFDDGAPQHAGCYGPAVAYVSHNDVSPPPSGTLPSGDVAMWTDADAGSGEASCAAAELNAQLSGPQARVRQALLLMAGLRRIVSADSTLSLPADGETLDLLTRASTLLASAATGITVQAATITFDNIDGQYTYRLVLSRGAGASHQSAEIVVLHTPSADDTIFAGTVQISTASLTADATRGCAGHVDGATSRYQVAHLTTLGYNRLAQALQLRLRSAQYCGAPASTSSRYMTELAEVTGSGEIESGISQGSGDATHTAKGWKQNLLRLGMDVELTGMTIDFIHAWQAVPDSGHARIFAGNLTLDSDLQGRTARVFHGVGDDIGLTDGSLQGMVCNVSGPGANPAAAPAVLFQAQTLSLPAGSQNWLLAASQVRHAPTNSCDSSGTMRFDVDADNTVDAGEGADVAADLASPQDGRTDVQSEILFQGFVPPTLF